MTTFSKILVPFDDNIRSIRALEYAAMFASGIGAKITALHISDPKDYRSKEEFDLELEAMVENQLRPKLVEIQQIYPDIRKIDLQFRGLEKSIHRHILEFARENEIDFMVMRSHGLSDVDDWELHFKSTTAYKVLLEAPCPIFTFTQIPDKPTMKNILVPIDLSEGSLYKVPFAITLAQRFHSKLHLVTASEYIEDHAELIRQMEEVHDELIQRDIAVVKSNVYSGTLPEAIFSYCHEIPMDLVIIMSRPGFKWSDLWVSPKAKRIISLSKAPVLSLRTDKPFDISL